MDPGNWATSLAGGSKFRYTLLVVALVSNLMAIVLQSLCARFAIASGRDLAQACRDAFPKWVNIPLWFMAELAIIATDIAEVIGTATGLNRLFGIPMLGMGFAPSLFAIALLACELNFTVTATLAGQAVMEGFLNLRIAPWMRRLVTRSIAIIPEAGVTILYGSAETGQLLILTQVVLSLQLSFAVVPLVMFTTDRRKMGGLVAPFWLGRVAAVIAVVIVALNLKLLWDFVT